MRAIILPWGAYHDPLLYPNCLLGEQFREYQHDDLVQLAVDHTVIIEHAAHNRLYHICYNATNTNETKIIMEDHAPGVHELYYFRGTPHALQTRFQLLDTLMATANTVETDIVNAIPTLRINNRDPVNLRETVAYRIYRSRNIRIKLTWTYDKIIILIHSVAPTSEMQLLREEHRLGESDLATKVAQAVITAWNADNEFRPKFRKFQSESWRPEAPATQYNWIFNNNSLQQVRFIAIVRVRHRRIYSDIEQPGTECWYLLDALTYTGHSLSMITDGEQFCPVRLVNSATVIATLIEESQLSGSIALDHIGPADQQLIVAAIKHGLDRRLPTNLTGRS